MEAELWRRSGAPWRKQTPGCKTVRGAAFADITPAPPGGVSAALAPRSRRNRAKSVAARNYEPAALSSSESAGLALFLMSLDRPDASVRKAVDAAVATAFALLAFQATLLVVRIFAIVCSLLAAVTGSLAIDWDRRPGAELVLALAGITDHAAPKLLGLIIARLRQAAGECQDQRHGVV